MSKPLNYILHLDDHQLFLNGFQTAVTKISDNYRFIQFQHPDEALDYIETSFEIDNPVDIIITDFNHMGLNGYDFSCAVKNLEIKYKRHYKIPVLMVSMVVSYFHPGKETITDFVIRNKREELMNMHYTNEWVVKGIEENTISALLGKNCVAEQIIELVDYLDNNKILYF